LVSKIWFLKSVGKKTALWLLPEGLAFAVGAKAKVPFAGCQRISKYFVRGQKN